MVVRATKHHDIGSGFKRGADSFANILFADGVLFNHRRPLRTVGLHDCQIGRVSLL